MNLFETVKQAVTPRQAAELYGVKVNRNGMACCPFHQDKHPSMKFYKERFHCFGCQSSGDVIDFTALLYGIPAKEAAQKLADDFGISYELQGNAECRAAPRSVRPKISNDLLFRQTEQKYFMVYSEYLHLLKRWREEYAPAREDENWHPRFLEALEKQTFVEYVLDTLLSGTLEERAELIAAKKKEVMQIERRIEKPTTGNTSGIGYHCAYSPTGTDNRGSEGSSGSK